MPCRLVAILLLLAAVTGCTSARSPVRREVSGFLDDYSTLREGGPGEVALVYRNPQADWKSYDKVLLEPVTLCEAGGSPSTPCQKRICSDSSTAWRAPCADGSARASVSSKTPDP